MNALCYKKVRCSGGSLGTPLLSSSSLLECSFLQQRGIMVWNGPRPSQTPMTLPSRDKPKFRPISCRVSLSLQSQLCISRRPEIPTIDVGVIRCSKLRPLRLKTIGFSHIAISIIYLQVQGKNLVDFIAMQGACKVHARHGTEFS